MTEAPFKWEYINQQHDMLFLSGFIGIEQTSDGYVKPLVGWAIAQRSGENWDEEESSEYEEGEDEEQEEDDEDDAEGEEGKKGAIDE